MNNIVQFPKKPIAQILSEDANKIQNDTSIPYLERTCLAAILSGDDQTALRLLDIGAKMQERNIRVVP